jgi:hypothetical protein
MPTSRRIRNMQLIQDDQQNQMMHVINFFVILELI